MHHDLADPFTQGFVARKTLRNETAAGDVQNAKAAFRFFGLVLDLVPERLRARRKIDPA